MNNRLILEFAEDTDWLGGALYIENLIAALSALPPAQLPAVALRFLSSPHTGMAMRLTAYPAIKAKGLPGSGSAAVARMRRVHRALVRRWPALGVLYRAPRNDVFFPAFDTRQSWRRNLYWIPDFQIHHLPEFFTESELDVRHQSFTQIAKQHGILVLSSRSALDDFHRFYPEAQVIPQVWSFCSSIGGGAASAAESVRQRYQLPAKFLYIANQFWRHKDHGTAFAALRLLREQGCTVPLVCTGLQNDRRDAAYFASVMSTIGNHTGQSVQLLGVLPRADQIQVLRCAAAVVQPSRFEGWSTVVEDAKAIGRPIVASDIAVHQEQLAGWPGAHFFRAGDPVDLARVLAPLWPHLQPGPDSAREQEAALWRDARRLDSARRFLEILAAAGRADAPGYGRQT